LKKTIATIAIAIVLGVTVMLSPVMTFMYLCPTTAAMDSSEYGQENKGGTQLSGEACETQGIESTFSAAQTYGRMDIEPVPFPSSLLYVMLLVLTGLVAALAATLYFRNRIGIFRTLFHF
jgi:hypothetical protein